MTAREQHLRRHDHLTFKGNLRETRYGWLRLTPAYSVHLVTELLESRGGEHPRVLDPFCGTGTTALVCAERGIACDTTDINPFLLWLTETKAHAYTAEEIEAFRHASSTIADALGNDQGPPAWVPPMHQIERWWDAPTLDALGHALSAIKGFAGMIPSGSIDLLKIAFCRIMIERSNASFGHQSMSFKKQAPTNGGDTWIDCWQEANASIAHAAQSPILTMPRTFLCDARELPDQLPLDAYDCVITSPPYPNRMSYIRELRPYMYWLGYLQDGRQAGELDWQAIGGTWGVATSKVAKWTPDDEGAVPFPGFTEILDAIAARSPVLSRYVHKYFTDMAVHTRALYQVVRPGGTIHYIVGNSRFYDVLLPVEQIFAALFEVAGFTEINSEVIRKRTSKKELFEYLVSARKPCVAERAVEVQRQMRPERR